MERTTTTRPPRPQARPGIMDIAIYVPGESGTGSGRPQIKLSSNETPLGASSAAVEAYGRASRDLARYPDGGANALRSAIADQYGLNRDRIICGAGSDEILSLLAAAYLQAGDEAIYSQYGFLMYRIAILANGATPVVAPEDNYTASVDAILACANARTRLVFLANPNNPTGTYLPIDEVRRLRAGLDPGVLLVLDAAYAEYVRRNDYEAGLELVATTENTVMTRTFSKIHGLAALRLGWAYCPENVIDVLNRIRGPFNVSSPALAAGQAAIRDTAHLDNSVAHNDAALSTVCQGLQKIGLEFIPSVGNFITVIFPEDAQHNAAAADAHLKSNDIIVRRLEGYGIANGLRVTLGTESENRAVLDALGTFMKGRAGAKA